MLSVGNQALGAEIVRLRDALGWQQIDLARALGYKEASSVSLWESGERGISAKNLSRIAVVLKVNVKHLRSFGTPYDPTASRRTKRQREAATKGRRPHADEPGAGSIVGQQQGDAAKMREFVYEWFSRLSAKDQVDLVQQWVAPKVTHPKTKAGGES